MNSKIIAFISITAALAGCASSYSWKNSVPTSARTITVSTFRNESELAEIGSLATRQILREIQREGTFKIAPADEAAIEIQGTVFGVGASTVGYDRRQEMRLSASEATAIVEVSVIDKRNGKILINNRRYQPKASYVTLQDASTSERDASGRLADDLAQMVIDDLLNLKW